MNPSKTPASPYALTVKRNTRTLALWTLVWTLSVALVSFGHKLLWDENKLVTSLALGLNVLAGVGLILAQIRYLKGTDEVQQRVQLNAMGMALGVTLVFGIFYAMLAQTGLIPGDAEIAFLIIVASLTYMISIAIGNWQYR